MDFPLQIQETDWIVSLFFVMLCFWRLERSYHVKVFNIWRSISYCTTPSGEASFGVIGKKLGKDRTTIAKEIKRHSYDKKSGRPGYPYNPCKHRSTCKAKKLCGNSCTHQSAYKCSLCSERTLHCPNFAEDICSVKTKPPYVCNGCSQLPKCTLLKGFIFKVLCAQIPISDMCWT